MLTRSCTSLTSLISITTSLRQITVVAWLGEQQPQDSQQDIRATEVKLLTKEKALEVEFSSGERYRLPAELLRVHSPSAAALLDRQGRPRLVSGRRHVGLLGVEPVGLYSLRLQFDDLHDTGLYTWQFLHDLGKHKTRYIREYIKKLRELGLSRDPGRRPTRKAVGGAAQRREDLGRGGG